MPYVSMQHKRKKHNWSMSNSVYQVIILPKDWFEATSLHVSKTWGHRTKSSMDQPSVYVVIKASRYSSNKGADLAGNQGIAVKVFNNFDPSITVGWLQSMFLLVLVNWQSPNSSNLCGSVVVTPARDLRLYRNQPWCFILPDCILLPALMAESRVSVTIPHPFCDGDSGTWSTVH